CDGQTLARPYVAGRASHCRARSVVAYDGDIRRRLLAVVADYCHAVHPFLSGAALQPPHCRLSGRGDEDFLANSGRRVERADGHAADPPYLDGIGAEGVAADVRGNYFKRLPHEKRG